MKAKYGIPQADLDVVIKRERGRCVYCRKLMASSFDHKNRKDSWTIEHLNHKQEWESVRDFVTKGKSAVSIIAICCGSCNSSRGSKPILEWFESKYCKQRNINYDKVARVVRDYIDTYERKAQAQ